MAAPTLRTDRVEHVALKFLNPDPDNPRQAIGSGIAELADSLKARGVLVPLLVRRDAKGRIVIKDGHRRWTAAKQAKLKTVPVVLASDADTAQLRLDQVAVNQLHEHLAPMDTARMLRKLRDEQKLTPNDLAARMAKAGTAMSTKEIEASIALTLLPEWAQTMVDKQQLEVDAAPALIAAAADSAIAKGLRSTIGQIVGWRGVVKKNDVAGQIRGLYSQTGVSLTDRYSYSDKERARLAHFDWKKVCKGCEQLRTVGNEAWCMSAKLFAQHNDEAKAAGLGVGGAAPKTKDAAAKADGVKLTKRQQEKLEAEKAERREKVDGTRAENYLDQWLRGKVAEGLWLRPDLTSSIAFWLASSRPDAGLIGNSYISGMTVSRAERTLQSAAGRAPRFDAFLHSVPAAAELNALAVHALPLLLPGQVREVAAALGTSIPSHWRADAEYVALRSREQLVEWLELYGLSSEGKVGELRQRLLDHPHTLEFSAKLSHMAALDLAYTAPVRDEERAARAIAEDEEQLEADDDAAYDEEDEARETDEDDDSPHGPGEDTNVEDCVSYADEEVDA